MIPIAEAGGVRKARKGMTPRRLRSASAGGPWDRLSYLPPQAARDVPLGHFWAWRSHRSMQEVINSGE